MRVDSSQLCVRYVCSFQKCLIHLIRDLNDDLKSNPYDEEFKALAGEFAKLLRSIVGTIDKYGLKKCHLHKHKAEVDCFFRDLATRVYRSELAEGYQKRLVKNEGALFTFLDHDGVPWNNNNAEHAIKYFAYYREVTDGQMKETGLSDYLVLLSVYETCKYRGVSFLKFLLSQEDDVEAFSRRGRKKKKRPTSLEVYPKGFRPRYRNRARKGDGEEGGGRASKSGWKQAILAFLRGRPETGAVLRDIADHCVGLIRGGTLVAVVSSDDRPRVDKSVWQCLDAMKKEDKVAKTPDRAYRITVRGLAWLERYPSRAHEIRPTDEGGLAGKP